MHDHHHHDSREKNRSKLWQAFILIFLFMFVEAVAGYLANSLALLSDAGHMLTDAGAIGLSLLAIYFAEKAPTRKNTFGFYRAEILAAFINGLTLVALSIYIVYEAIARLKNPVIVDSRLLTIVAIIGLIVNIIAGLILYSRKDQSLNIKGAYLHVLGDTLGSVGAITAGIIITVTRWYWVDVIVSILICVLIVISSLRLLKQTVHVLMEGVPEHLSFDEIRDTLCSLEFVDSIHDLHIWTLTSGVTSLSVHVNINKDCGHSCNNYIDNIKRLLKERFNISHTTIQIEHDDFKEDSSTIHTI